MSFAKIFCRVPDFDFSHNFNWTLAKIFYIFFRFHNELVHIFIKVKMLDCVL